MSDRKRANIERINELWGLHEPQDEGLKGEGRCLAFAIDQRYVEQDGIEMRLAVSFGHPVVGPVTEGGFLPIPGQPGEFVFGLHLIGTKGSQVTIYDQWANAMHADGCADPVEAEAMARAILDAMSDQEYLAGVRESKEDKAPLKVSTTYLLEDFEVVEGEAW